MNSDSYFSIGKTHIHNDDYALSKDMLEDSLIVVSDGCSSSPHTDFGSRILTQTLIKSWLSYDKINHLDFLKSLNCWKIAESLALPNSCLDATLIYAFKHNNLIKVVAVGDGTIAIKDKFDITTILTISYKGNAPLYLNYFVDYNRMKALKEMFDCTKEIKTTIIDPHGKIISTSYISSNDIEEYAFPIDEVKSISIFTDGISSFTKAIITPTSKSFEPVPEYEIIRKLVDYKGTAGVFVQRVTKKTLKDLKDIGIENNDDLSVATINLG